MGMESVGTQAAQQLMSSFKSSMSEQQRMMRESKDKIKHFTVDKPVGVVKGKAINKAVDKAGKEFAKTQIGKSTIAAVDKTVGKAAKVATKVATKAAAPVAGAVTTAAKVAAKGAKAAVVGAGVMAKKGKDAVIKGGAKTAAAMTKSQDKNKNNKAPDRSAAIIKNGQNIAKKGIDLGR